MKRHPTSKIRLSAWAWLWISLLLLAGCTSFVDQDQPQRAAEATVVLQAEFPVGQSFAARHARLNGVDIWLEPGSADGNMRLHLRSDSQSETDLALVILPLSQVTQPGFYRFAFAPFSASHNRDYYLFLEVEEAAQVFVGAAAPDVYWDGSLYRSHQPVDGQMTFRLAYDWWGLGTGLLQAVFQGLGSLAITGLLYGVPGWALLILIQRYAGPLVRHWTEGVGVAVGLSLALYPCLMLWTYLVGLQLGAFYAWLPVLLGIATLVWHYRPWHWRWSMLKTAVQERRRRTVPWSDLVFIGVVCFVGLQRFLMIVGLELPLWMDSVQHTMIVQRIVEAGGLFQSWQPYAPYQTFSQQFGFHTLVAVWAWLTGVEASQAVLLSGQALNVLAVVALYPLAYRMKGVWAGIFTMLLAGVFLQLPAFYTNWGRYPQMCGQAILMFAAWWGWCARESTRKLWPWVLGGGLTLAGVVLVYYRMIFHYVTFILASLLIVSKDFAVLRKWRYWLCLAGIGILGGLLAFPWLFRIIMQPNVSTILFASTPSLQFQDLLQLAQQIRISWPLNHALWIFLGGLLGIWINDAAILPAVWGWLLMALPILRQFPLPGVSIIQTFTINTSLYMPQALTWGTLLGHWGEKLGAKRWRGLLAGVLLTGFTLYQSLFSLQWIDRGFALATRPDVRAAQWIEANLPADAVLLTRGTIYFGSAGEETAWWTAVVGPHAHGLDGGAWLSVLTRRASVIPLPYLLQSEQSEQEGYTEAVNNLTQRLLEVPVTSAEGIAALCAFPSPITHLYLGQRQAVLDKVATGLASSPLFDGQQLQQSPSFHLLYHQDRVMLFEFDRTICR
ncbi:MAG: hypothetical protein JXB35_18180 [Anaerolineae bacterium]|nr:hypothetical protein [Anaerolineae bacterium]